MSSLPTSTIGSFSICDFSGPHLRIVDALLRASPDIVLVCDAEGHFVYVGNAAAQAFGRTTEQLLGLNFRQINLPTATVQRLDSERARVLKTGLPISGEISWKMPHGWRECDYVLSPVMDEDGLSCATLFTGRDMTERNQTEIVSRRLAAIVDSSEDAIIGKDLNGIITSWNRAAERMLGYTAEEIIGQPKTVLFPPDRLAEEAEILRRLRAGESTKHFESVRLHKDGSLISVAVTVSPIRSRDGRIVGASTIIRDIMERKRLEAQYIQAQKMEGIGRLAGGIAHDFNNLLTAIMGYSELAELEVEADSPALSHLQTVQQAAQRAAALTHQLLAFARKQIIAPKIFSLNDLILEADRLLRRVIGEDIEFVTLPHPGLGYVQADPNQITQILVNLAVNARDAMPGGGTLTIETANVTLDSHYVAVHANVQAGEYVMLAVGDTGAGMTEEVKSHLFEPFYTTKSPGKGTGLGLATCYGIVKQNGGHIWVYSEPQQGTIFKIYLPRIPETADATVEETPRLLPTGTETLLVVEDEPLVRDLAVRTLRDQGYTVLEAANGNEALRVVETHSSHIHLLITDVVMPQMGGKELAQRLLEMQPDIKVLYMSGYTDNAIVHHGVLDAGVLFLQKPYTPLLLAQKVRDVLDARPTNAP